jgi:hypothetical protein
MCCFSGSVERVANTRIFVRASAENRQYLVYQMEFSAAQDLAMILPLPVPTGTPERAVRFINLEAYPQFFADMRSDFPNLERTRSTNSFGPVAASAPLEVVNVGSFDASFVPSRKDFSRLDARFRLPDGVWDNLPQYGAYGFAVFKLKKTAQTVHPMAFEFPRADPAHLFFPTVHIHDGQVHPQATFDHALYCQGADGAKPLKGWRESQRLTRQFMDIDRAHGVLAPDSHCYLKRLSGSQPNLDILL